MDRLPIDAALPGLIAALAQHPSVVLQAPHRRDEVYVVVAGSGTFLNGASRHPFGSGDLLFVPAGVTHRFEAFTDDLVVWVIFYGPDGGEAEPAPRG